MESKKICMSCGAEIAGDAAFCPKCGSRQGETNVEKETTAENEKADATKQNDNADYNALVSAIVGKESNRYYRKTFARMERNGNIVSFNLHAFIFGPLWFCYRKMSLVGFILLGFQPFCPLWLTLVMRFMFAFTANAIYKSYIDKRIDAYKAEDEKSKAIFLSKFIGTSVESVVLCVIFSILLGFAAYFFPEIFRQSYYYGY